MDANPGARARNAELLRTIYLFTPTKKAGWTIGQIHLRSFDKQRELTWTSTYDETWVSCVSSHERTLVSRNLVEELNLSRYDEIQIPLLTFKPNLGQIWFHCMRISSYIDWFGDDSRSQIWMQI